MLKNPRIDEIRLDGGILCLDFVNTIPDRVDGSDRDNLTGFKDLIYWARKAGVLQASEMTALGKASSGSDRKAKDFFQEAIGLRTLIYSIFSHVSRGQKVKPVDLDLLNSYVSSCSSHRIIATTREGFSERWNFSRENFMSITAPIIWSAHDLLLSQKLGRVKECPSCGWLFFDSTKNGKRRWCSMEDCGSNIKALEYYYRKKKERK